MTLLEAARKALPGIVFERVVSNGVEYVYGECGSKAYGLFDHADLAEVVAEVTAKRDELDAILGETPRAVLTDDLNALRERMRWRDVADDCPDACVDVQVYSGHVQDGWHAEDGYFRDHDGMRIHNVTYWRPIDHPEFTAPEAPNV